MLEFDACVGSYEVPVGLDMSGITVMLPGGKMRATEWVSTASLHSKN